MKCAVIDSHYLCHKAKHSTGFMTYGSRGTGVLYGFLNDVLQTAKRFSPDFFIFTWDSRKSFRKDRYPFYKTRSSQKDDMTEEELKAEAIAYKQFTLLRKEILPAIGFKNNIMQKGLEADDIIAKLVMDERYQNINFLVETADNDLFQLLDYCRLYNPQKDMVLTDDVFESLYKIKPHQWAEVKAIAGCTSDTVPGVNNVGDKTAIKYINGELKSSSVLYQRIQRKSKLIERNRWLVYLPHQQTKDINITTKNEFNIKEFIYICRDFGLTRFRKNIEEWRTHFVKS